MAQRNRFWALPLFALGFTACTSQSAQPVRVDGQTLELQRIVDEVHRQSGVPALAAAWARSDGTIRAAVAGVRRIDAPDDPVRIDDRAQLGAVSESLAALPILRLIRDNLMQWESTVQSALKELEADIRPEFRAVTLEQLLTRHSPLVPFSASEVNELRVLARATAPPKAVRESMVRWLLQHARAPGTPDVSFLDPNYLVAAHMTDHADGGVPFEKQLLERGFQRLGVAEDCAFGTGDGPERVTLPGHVGTPAAPAIATADVDAVPAVLAPIAGIRCSIVGLARSARRQVQALRGASDFVNAVDMQRLFSAAQPNAASGRRIYSHTAGARSFAAMITLLPDDDLTVVVTANAGFGDAACQRTTNEILTSLRVPSR